MDNQIQPLALRPRQAAAALQVSPRKLWSLTHPRGPLRAVRLGKGKACALLYPVDELRRWLEEAAGAQTQQAAGEAETTQ